MAGGGGGVHTPALAPATLVVTKVLLHVAREAAVHADALRKRGLPRAPVLVLVEEPWLDQRAAPHLRTRANVSDASPCEQRCLVRLHGGRILAERATFAQGAGFKASALIHGGRSGSRGG